MVERRRLAQREDLARDEYVWLTLYAEPKEGFTLDAVAEHIARLWSSDTVEDKSYRTHVTNDSGHRVIELAIPVALIGPRLGLTQVMNVLAIPAEYEHCKRLLFERIEFPQGSLSAYRGPRLGVEGLRKAFSVPDGPLLGAILKPRLIHDLKSVADSVRDLASAGLDFVVDDELMIDSDAAPFEKRVSEISKILFENPSSLGIATAFVANVTARPSESLRLARTAKQLGARGIVTNPIVTGLGALEDLAGEELNLPIFANNMGTALLAKGSEGGSSAGMSEALVCKLTRLAGADAVHGGIEKSDWYDEVPKDGTKTALGGGLSSVRPAFRVIAGGLTIVSMLDNWPLDDEPVVFEGGSSIFRHPSGAGAGARAFRKAWEIGRRHIRDDADSRISAKAALVELAGRDPDIEQAVTACKWDPPDEVVNRSRGIKPTKSWIERLRGRKHDRS